MVPRTAGKATSATRSGLTLRRADAPVHSWVHQWESKYAGEHSAIVRPAASICRLIQSTKFPPAGESHSCSRTRTRTRRPSGRLWASRTEPVQTAHASSAPV